MELRILIEVTGRIPHGYVRQWVRTRRDRRAIDLFCTSDAEILTEGIASKHEGEIEELGLASNHLAGTRKWSVGVSHMG